jgi:hypothetical protein
MLSVMAYAGELPKQCPNHRVFRGPGTVVVIWLPCACAGRSEGRRGHRTVSCLGCNTTWYNPPHEGRDWIPDAEIGRGQTGQTDAQR